MKIATWNVNSLRVRLPHVIDWLKEHEPDILGLQETKLPDHDFPGMIRHDASRVQIETPPGLLPEAFDDYLEKHPDAPDPDKTARLALLRKKNTFLRENNLQRRQQKMYRFLYNRGFPGEIISRAIQTVDLTSTE